MVQKGVAYIKSLPGLLKLIQFVILLAAIACVGYFMDNNINIKKKKGNLQFFMFVVIVAWILVITTFVVFVSNLRDKISRINWSLSVTVLFLLWAILLLISSALVADTVRYFNDKKMCDGLDMNKAYGARCKQLIGGAVCGFFSMALFLADAYLAFRVYISGSDNTQTTG